MRIKYSKNEVQHVFDKLVDNAITSYNRGEYEKSRQILETAADFQYNLNVVYSDSRCEDLIGKMSDRLGRIVNYYPVKDNILFYDCFAWDNRGLTQQYLDALISSRKYKILFVHESNFSDNSKEILTMLRQNKVEVIELGTVSWNEKQKVLTDLVNSFKPEKVLCHLTPSTTLPLVTFGRFHELVKYQINLTDHAFWLGGRLFDFSFEFREYGCMLSCSRRSIAKNKLLLLPYYPWVNSVNFKGFPIDVKGKTVLFSGGSLYKIEDKKDTFFHIVRSILERHSNTIMMLAGEGNRMHIVDLIKQYNLENRFILLGNRTDICQVFAHSDIYISTYPLGGGLMSQYAAYYGLPILAYQSHDVEQVVCTRQKGDFSFDSISDLIFEADKLIADPFYRKERGKYFKALMQDVSEFRNKFEKLFEQSVSNVEKLDGSFDFDKFYKKYLDRFNAGKMGLTLENRIRQTCPIALSWKMWANIVLQRVLGKFKRILYRFLRYL